MKTRNSLLGLLASVIALSLTACAPSASQLEKVIGENPNILYAAMRKDPAKFIDVVNEVAEAAKSQKESQQFEEGFKNPMKFSTDGDRAIEGTPGAPITIVEYSDFQCPYCSRGHETMKQVLEAFPGKVQIIFKNFPIERIHPQAMRLSKTYEAIATKDKAKAAQFKNQVFTGQEAFNPNDAERKSKDQKEFMDKYNRRVEGEVAKMVKGLGFNPDEIKKIAESEAVTKVIAADQEEAQSNGFSGTPGYLVNGVPVRGAYPIETFKTIIERHLAKK